MSHGRALTTSPSSASIKYCFCDALARVPHERVCWDPCTHYSRYNADFFALANGISNAHASSHGLGSSPYEVATAIIAELSSTEGRTPVGLISVLHIVII